MDREELEAQRERTRMDSISLTCPVCGTFFISWEVQSFGYETRRSDFRPNFPGLNPMKLYYHTCPECRFCADQMYFDLELTRAQKKELREKVASLYKKLAWEMKRSVAAQLYYGALIGELLQSMGLINESFHDRAQSFIQAWWWAEPKEREPYGEIALWKLRDNAKVVDPTSEEAFYTRYMEGEINRRLGDSTEARRHFEKLLGARSKYQNESNRFLFDLAERQMTSPSDEMSEESLNPYKKKGRGRKRPRGRRAQGQ